MTIITNEMRISNKQMNTMTTAELLVAKGLQHVPSSHKYKSAINGFKTPTKNGQEEMQT